MWKDIARSWMALKTWVKVWLFFLNAVLLASLAFLRDPAGYWIAFAYIAAGPFLITIAVAQRGLSRVIGIAHLIPRIPLLAYLVLRASSDTAGPRVTPDTDSELFAYLIVVIASVAVCLGFDVYDLYRWIRGERFLMGSEEAYRAGASMRPRV